MTQSEVKSITIIKAVADKTLCLIPSWHDHYIDIGFCNERGIETRYCWQMQYMEWLKIYEAGLLQRTTSLSILHRDETTRKKLKEIVGEKTPVFVNHGAHGWCNLITGNELNFVCSPPRPDVYCYEDHGDAECSEPNHTLFKDTIFNTFSCLSNVELGRAIVEEIGGKAFLGYKDVSYMEIGYGEDKWFYEEACKGSEAEKVRTIAEGKTIGEAYKNSVAKYNSYIDKWKELGLTTTFLEHNRDALLLRGDEDAKIRTIEQEWEGSVTLIDVEYPELLPPNCRFTVQCFLWSTFKDSVSTDIDVKIVDTTGNILQEQKDTVQFEGYETKKVDFRFNGLEKGNYTISVNNNEYPLIIDDVKINITKVEYKKDGGQIVPIDVTIQPQNVGIGVYLAYIKCNGICISHDGYIKHIYVRKGETFTSSINFIAPSTNEDGFDLTFGVYYSIPYVNEILNTEKAIGKKKITETSDYAVAITGLYLDDEEIDPCKTYLYTAETEKTVKVKVKNVGKKDIKKHDDEEDIHIIYMFAYPAKFGGKAISLDAGEEKTVELDDKLPIKKDLLLTAIGVFYKDTLMNIFSPLIYYSTVGVTPTPTATTTPTPTITPTPTPTASPTPTVTPTATPTVAPPNIITCIFPRLSTGNITPRISTGDPIPRISCLQKLL